MAEMMMTTTMVLNGVESSCFPIVVALEDVVAEVADSGL
jgi:hypothetical protein